MLAERPAPAGAQLEGAVGPGALLSAAALLSGTRTSATLRAASSTCRLLAFGAPELQQLLVSPLREGPPPAATHPAPCLPTAPASPLLLSSAANFREGIASESTLPS